MAFRLYTDAEGIPTNYDDDEATYTFNEHGLLVVTANGKRSTFAPHAWHHLEEDEIEPFVVS